MKDVMGIIYTSKNDLTLRELTVSRAVAALPIAGRYRMIDFILSNMVNTEIPNVGVIMQRNYHSLMDHLGSGKDWDLHTRNDGLFILPPFLTRENVGSYGGIIDALRSNMGYLRRSRQDTVVLTNSNAIYSMSFDSLIREHHQSGADITLMYVDANRIALDDDPLFTGRHVYLGVDLTGRVNDLEVGPSEPSYHHLYTDVMVISRSLLIHLIDQAVARSTRDFNRDILLSYIQNGLLRIHGYEFTGYYRRVESVLSYYRANLDLLNSGVRGELFALSPVYTKVRDEVPARYLGEGIARDSLVADGCLVEGEVTGSILFRGVRVGRGAKVKDAIVMQAADIQQGAEIENVILDKNVVIRSGGRLIGQPTYPIVIGKGSII